MSQELTPVDYWRAIILHGRNTATYKMALGKILLDFARDDKSEISRTELATAFFHEYRVRLTNGRPQLANRSKQAVMERIVTAFNEGDLTISEATARVRAEAFRFVLDCFHVVNNEPIIETFFEITDAGLVLTDALHDVAGSLQVTQLFQELRSRWDLLEAAFAMKRQPGTLRNDRQFFYLQSGQEQVVVTENSPVLSGYQNGRCFYCREAMTLHQGRVWQVIPPQCINCDALWNLVLAHDSCGEDKGEALPTKSYIEKLICRNEYFIASDHPIRHSLIAQLGKTAHSRGNYVLGVYENCRQVTSATWGGASGYSFDEDTFYRVFVSGAL